MTGYLAATNAPETLLAVTAYRMGERVRNHTIGGYFLRSLQIVASGQARACQMQKDQK